MYYEIPKTMEDFSATYFSDSKNKADRRKKAKYVYNLSMMFRFIKAFRFGLNLENILKIEINDIDIEFIKEITLEELHEYLKYFKEEKKRDTVDISKKILAMKQFFNYLVKENILTENPTEKIKYITIINNEQD